MNREDYSRIDVGGMRYEELLNLYKGELRPILARKNGEYFELTEALSREVDLVPVYTDDYVAHKTYERTLSFILVTAFYRLFKDKNLVIDHSISRGLYCWVEGHKVTKEERDLLYEEMKKIVEENYPITKECFSLKDVLERLRNEGHEDQYHLLVGTGYKEITLYKLADQYEYFYGKMANSTGHIDRFDLILYKNGFVMTYPTIVDPYNIKEFEPQEKLFKIFEETARWDELIGVNYAGYLNKKIRENQARELINITEALHEKKIAYIADDIKARGQVKIVLIAGPSSSGKTSFAHRLGIQLRVNGLVPIPVSMDDYFVPRRLTPLKKDGSFDFESVEALELDLFERDMMALLDGQDVRLPKFDFKTGERGIALNKVRIPENGVIIIEGIHGLNPVLLSHIEDKFKFKIYISALTVLNLDRHNRIATTDVRKLRRMARDYISRGYSPEETLMIFPSVTLGEKTNIFPYQEEADVMFNSTILYELAVLKKHTLNELLKITTDSETYEEAKRLITMLRLFEDISDDLVPTNSLLREFIGGSQFYDY